MSRDARFTAHRLMRRVDPRTQTPVPAILLILALGFVLMVALPGAALLELITASTILPALIYGATIVLYLAVRGRLGRQEGAFGLGRLELPVAVCALAWTLLALLALFVLVTPREALVPVVVVAGLLLLGGLFFLGTLMFHREALDTEPGGDSFRWGAREWFRPGTTKRRVTGPSVTRRSGCYRPTGRGWRDRTFAPPGGVCGEEFTSSYRGLCAWPLYGEEWLGPWRAGDENSGTVSLRSRDGP
ncbi:hypothetical protein OG239_33350 [Streptomyces sp. NBC_00868]|uniref:hypothetical protein n=1 Tax=unclassified Streptomyces TaxID=2593676 RepID=UPI0032545B10|nr:hypothetical protein OG239_33350 [Streptomyces sp. NBC_00868]